MIVLDYIIRNEDRHLRNFGLIRNVETLEYTGAAPIFDTGTSLLFDTATEDILKECNSPKSPSKPFRATHDKQIQLVKHPERFDLGKLKSIDDEIRNILKTNDFIAENRIDALCRAVCVRIKRLKKIFDTYTIE